jgi:hypothetical protein
MKAQFASIVVVSSALSALSYAGQHVGNGGDAHVCYDGNRIRSAELFDFYEIPRIAEGIYIELGAEGMTWQQKVEFSLQRLARLDPIRAARLQQRFEDVFVRAETKDYKFVSEQLPDEPDHGGTGVLPQPGCKIEQAAIRIREVVAPPYEKRFRINQPIFDAMDATNRAGLILHELLYEEAIHRGFMNSRRVRFFTAFVSSSLIDTFDLASYQSLLRRDLFMADHQLLFDRNDETYLVEFHAEPKSFVEAAEDCEAQGGGVLLNGYNADFKVLAYANSPLFSYLNGKEWWGEIEIAPSGQVLHFAVSRQSGRFYRRGTAGSTVLGYICMQQRGGSNDSAQILLKDLCEGKACLE